MEDFQLKVSAFFEMTPDLVCIAGRNGFFKKVNKSVQDTLGYTLEELLSRPIDSFVYEEDKEITRQSRVNVLNGSNLLNFENRYIRKDGSLVWLEWTSIYFADDEVVFAIAKDITEKKKSQNEIAHKFEKFKGLANHFKTSIEQDRKYLASELHEELAQLASVVKMDVDWIGIKEPNLSDASKKRIQHASLISELLINTIRRITFSISPTLIEDSGLDATLEFHCKEFSILNGIDCVFENNHDEANLPLEIKIDFFRICQEALSNIMYHASANKVKISLDEKNDGTLLTIEDDGKGFIPETREQYAGLSSMRERAASINGVLTIDSQPGRGTCITVFVKH